MARVGRQLDSGHRLAAICGIWVWHEARACRRWRHAGSAQPVPQPNLVPVSLRSSRMTHKQWRRGRRICRRLAVHTEVRGHCFLPARGRPRGRRGLSNHSAKEGLLQWRPCARAWRSAPKPDWSQSGNRNARFSAAHRKRLPTFRSVSSKRRPGYGPSQSLRLIRKTSRVVSAHLQAPWSRPRTSAGDRRKTAGHRAQPVRWEAAHGTVPDTAAAAPVQRVSACKCRNCVAR